MVFALKHYSISLEDMPKEHVFLHIAKSCTINSLNRGVFWDEGGRSEPSLGCIGKLRILL